MVQKTKSKKQEDFNNKSPLSKGTNTLNEGEKKKESIPSTYSFRKSGLRKLSYSNFIVITVTGEISGGRQILSELASSDIYPKRKIKNNGEEENFSGVWDYLPLETNVVKLIWDHPLTSCKNMFKNTPFIISIDLSNFDFSQVTDMDNFFSGCWQVRSINFQNPNVVKTYNLKNMNHTFFNCPELDNLDLRKFDTTKVTIMENLFRECKSIKSLDLSHFYTPALTNMKQIFCNCQSLEFLDISNFNTAKIDFLALTFQNCYNLKYLDLRNFDTSLVTEMAEMFMNCHQLTSVEISSFNTEKVWNMGHMFHECHSLKYLDLSHFHTPNILYIDHMFYNCHNLEYIDVINFNTEKVFNYENMFNECNNLISLNLTNFIILEETNIRNMIFHLKPEVILCYNELKVTDKFKEEEAKYYKNSCVDVCDMQAKIFIEEVSMCIDKCFFSGTDYKFEYEHKCYTECPIRTKFYSDTKLCEDCRDYYSLDNTACLDTVPDGCYNDNPSAKTIKPCPTECKKCSLASVNQNKCIECNNDGYYYYKSNDPLNTGTFFKCYHKNDVQTDYYLDNNVFKPCYSMCNKCTGNGDSNNHHCTECKNSVDYEVRDGNCICKHFYKYDKTGCLDDVPDGYYNDNPTARTIEKCPPKCSTCTLESINDNNKCTTCNNINYYPKYPENLNSKYECYQGDQLYYYFDNIGKIFKRCHSMCKKCNGEGTNSNHNCIECVDEDNEVVSGNCMCINYYNYEKTGCIDGVPDGYYNDNPTARTIEKCPPKCATCTLESINDNNKCTTCNNTLNYYPKSPENLNSKYECYEGEQLYYYLDTTDKIYKSCYSMCKKCDGEGDSNNHHCTECNDNDYEVVGINCMCKHFYKYDKTGCLDEVPDGYYNDNPTERTIEKCPIECSKCSLESVNENKCIECNNDDYYYYKSNDPLNTGTFFKCYHKNDVQTDYYLDNNIFKPCYSMCKNCIGNGDNNNHNCSICYNEDIYELVGINCMCINYYNYEKTGCIDGVPDGYYNDNPTARTIEKCPPKCATCTLVSLNDNNKCTTCNNTLNYYPKSPENLNSKYECYEGEQLYYYLDTTDKIYKSCYSMCKKCDGEGDSNNHHCTECNDNDYEVVGINCMCKHFYKYDKSGCLNEVPDGYYNDNPTERTIEKCPIECSKCSLESVNQNKCIECNNDDDYYYKSNDPLNTGTFFKCYHKNDVQTDYYLDNNIFKPCYSMCKNCIGEGTNTNHNCSICYNEDIYELVGINCMCINYYNYEKTGCIDGVPDGYYNDNPTARTIEKCPPKCSTCTLESINDNNLCTSCKITENYYPKSPENLNSKYECYQGEQLYYYLDTTEEVYKSCYSMCKKCDGEGDSNNHHCTECDDDDYEVVDGNCMCKHFYNIDKTGCLDEVPDGFYNDNPTARTIRRCPVKCAKCSLDSVNRNLCIECNNNDNYYHKSNDPLNIDTYYKCYYKDDIQTDYYLDDNIFKPCYSMCKKCNGEGTSDNHNCRVCYNDDIYELIDGNCICRNYYNYEKTGCIETVPNGFYNDDTTARTIEKCPNKCATCSLESINNNNLCVSCNMSGEYYPKYNDPTNVNPFLECYEREQTYYYLDTIRNIFKPCYSMCKFCDGSGNDINHRCIECKDEDYEVIYGNCMCKHFYNYEKTGCIETVPDGYYNDNIPARTIEKCPNKCATCTLESINNGNLCTSCNMSGDYYPKYNDSVNIDPFTECYLNELVYYYLDTDNNYFKPCYSKCKRCDGEGNEENNNCIECIDDGKVYNLTDGNCIYVFNYSYELDSVSDETKKDYTRTFIDMNEDTVSHLREIFSLGAGSKIYIMIKENDNSSSAMKEYTYEYILENGTILNLDDIEEDVYVDVYVPINDFDAINFELAKKYSDLGYDIYNLNSKFYTDFCTPVNLNGNDVPLAERKKEIYPNNVTLCKDNCVYKGINFEERRVICQCNINNKTDDEIAVQKNEKFEAYLVDYINWRLFLCYKLFFNAYYLRHSYAFFILLIIFLAVLIVDFAYINYTLSKLKSFLVKQMPSYHKFYKTIFSSSKHLNDNVDNTNRLGNDGKANPLKKDLEKKRDKKLKNIARASKKNKSEKIFVSNFKIKENYETIANTEEPIQSEHTNIKKEKKRKKSKIYAKPLEEKKDEINKDIGRKIEDINDLPYSKAIELDKRNIFRMYASFLLEKLDLINIFFISTRFKLILFIEFILSLLVNFFLNALLYSDEVVSHKYHNNGQLDFIVSLVLSILSNVVTSLFCSYISYSKGMDEKIDLILETKNRNYYLKNIKRIDLYFKVKFISFSIAQIIVFATCIYYVEIFCVKYYCSQISLLLNFAYSFIESIITSFAIAFIILVTRKIGLTCSNKDLYNTSKYINNKT